jgi:hypothetical protein
LLSEYNNNLELVSVWIDYMLGINWIHKDDGKWVANEEGKRWIQKYSSGDNMEFIKLWLSSKTYFASMGR